MANFSAEEANQLELGLNEAGYLFMWEVWKFLCTQFTIAAAGMKAVFLIMECHGRVNIKFPADS